MKSFAFQKTSNKMLLHQRANHADQKQWPQIIEYACHDLSVRNKQQKSHLLSQTVTLQSIIYPPEEKLIVKSSILARGRSCVARRPPFYKRNWLHSSTLKWQIMILLKDDRSTVAPRGRNSGIECLFTGDPPFPLPAIFSPFPKNESLFTCKHIWEVGVIREGNAKCWITLPPCL